MSDDNQSVNLDMLKVQLATAETKLRDAIGRRAMASKHLRQMHEASGGRIAASILSALDGLSETKPDDAFLALQSWAAAFPCDMAMIGVKRIQVAGSEALRIWDQARAIFGHRVAMYFDGDAREVLTRCQDETGCVGVVGWPTQAGSGQWWPVLNETRYHDLRIVGAWPVIGDAAPVAAIVTRGPLPLSLGKSTLLIAHDDHHKVGKIFSDLDMPLFELGRARSLVLFSVAARLAEDDARLKAARIAGLDGLRVVGALPINIHPAS